VTRPTAAEVSDRALVIYALARRGAIELVVNQTGADPSHLAQAERARVETDRWLDRESLTDASTDVERTLFSATSGTWPTDAITDALWRKESLGVLLWALQHVESLPGMDAVFEQSELDEAITRYGSVSAFRANGLLRPDDEVEAAWLEADAWFGATEGRVGEDAALASTAAERFRALSWLRDRDAAPA
jgi:hypothetical protein